jgi:hypothetical protein
MACLAPLVSLLPPPRAGWTAGFEFLGVGFLVHPHPLSVSPGKASPKCARRTLSSDQWIKLRKNSSYKDANALNSGNERPVERKTHGWDDIALRANSRSALWIAQADPEGDRAQLQRLCTRGHAEGIPRKDAGSSGSREDAPWEIEAGGRQKDRC